MKIFILVLLLLLSGQVSDCEQKNQLERQITLKYNQTIEIREKHLKIKFTSVLEDSRCPQGEQCIRAGNGSIKLDVSGAKGNTSFSLNTAVEPQETTYNGLGLRLIDLQPFPKSGQNLKSNDYIITLRVFDESEQN